MYVLEPNATSVAVLSLNAPGQAQNLGSFNLAAQAKSAGLVISMSFYLLLRPYGCAD